MKRRKHMWESKNLVSLPKDILLQIFLRLPVKSLARCRWVCKSLHNLIVSDMDFVLSRMKQSTPNRIIMFNPDTCENDDRLSADDQAIKLRGLSSLLLMYIDANDNKNKPVLLEIGKNLIVAGCTNGVICLYKYWTSTIYMWNPALRECRALQTISDIYLTDFVGFCYDGENQDHKVVKVSTTGSLCYIIELYSLKSDSWKLVWWSLPIPIHWIHNRYWVSSLNFNGCIHWIGYYFAASNGGENKFGTSIVAFDVAHEKLNLLQLPVESSFGILGVMHECFSFIAGDNRGTKGWDVWLMKTYGVSESWTKFVKIPSEVVGICRNLVHIDTNDKILFEKLKIVVAYDLVLGKILSSYSVMRAGKLARHFVFDYVVSLVSVMPPRHPMALLPLEPSRLPLAHPTELVRSTPPLI